MSLIAIEGMQFYAHHGYYYEEQKIGAQYVVDVYLRADLSEAAREDALAKTINYENLYTICEEIMDVRAHLIETVAQRILDRLGAEFNNLQYAKVRVSKMNPPLKGTVERVYVSLDKEFAR
jgi:dihydroneopterin aldolase